MAIRAHTMRTMGVMAFLLNFIPSVGSVVSTLLPLPIALIQFDSMTVVALVILLPGIVQFTIGTVIEPLFMGEGLDLHPVTILISLVVWGVIWGVVGMLLAAPITAIVRIVCARIADPSPPEPTSRRLWAHSAATDRRASPPLDG